MTVQAYFSTDASAPALTGQVGSLTALLDACLVNGYGSKSSLGWTIAYTGTNQRDYKQGAGSNGYYLDVNDAAPTTAQEARMRGYETMSALGTGTQAFPTAAQVSFGQICRKSNTADATQRKWYLIGDSTCFYLFVDTGDWVGPSYSTGFWFGDFFSYKSGDIYNTGITGRGAENTSSSNYETLPLVCQNGSLINGGFFGGSNHYVDRSWTGVGGAIQFSKFTSAAAGGFGYTQCVGSATCLPNYPNSPDGSLLMAPIWIAHNASIRGYMKGLWAPLHNQPLGHGDTFNGTGNMAGKSFLALNVQNQNTNIGAGNYGQIIVETSNTWS
jgi:hypothetical protein